MHTPTYAHTDASTRTHTLPAANTQPHCYNMVSGILSAANYLLSMQPAFSEGTYPMLQLWRWVPSSLILWLPFGTRG